MENGLQNTLMTLKSKAFGLNIMLRWGALKRLTKWDESLSVQKHNEKHSDEISEIIRQLAGISACCLEKRITELCIDRVPRIILQVCVGSFNI